MLRYSQKLIMYSRQHYCKKNYSDELPDRRTDSPTTQPESLDPDSTITDPSRHVEESLL